MTSGRAPRARGGRGAAGAQAAGAPAAPVSTKAASPPGVKAAIHAIRAHLRQFRYAFVVLPVGATLALMVLAFLVTWLDRAAGPRGIQLGPGLDPETARALLNSIAGSVATVAAITFSIAILALQLVSQQFSPRALRGFLGDRISQVIAGTFTGTIVYCFVVMRAIDGGGAGGGAPFVPSLAILVALVLAVTSILALLLFVSHISQRVQVSRIAGDIADGALGSLGAIYPEPFGAGDAGADPDALVARWRAEGAPQRVHPEAPGYVQSVAIDDVPELIGGRGARVHVCVAPGDFVSPDEPIAEVWGAQAPPERVERELRRAIAVEDERDTSQDYLYPIRQLADIAIKAMSPGINDPTTAWTCIAYLGTLVERLVRRGLPPRVRRGPHDATVVVRRHDLRDYADVAFVQIGRYAARDAGIAGRLLVEIARVARAASAPEDLALLERVARAVAEPARAHAETEHDRRELERALERALARLRGRSS